MTIANINANMPHRERADERARHHAGDDGQPGAAGRARAACPATRVIPGGQVAVTWDNFADGQLMANTVSAGRGYVYGGSTVPSGGTTPSIPIGTATQFSNNVQFPAGFDFSTPDQPVGHGRHRRRQRRVPGPDPDRPQRRPAHAVPRPDPDGRGHGQYRHRDQRHQRRSDLHQQRRLTRSGRRSTTTRPATSSTPTPPARTRTGAVHRQLRIEGRASAAAASSPRRLPPAGDRPQRGQRHLEARDQRHQEQHPGQPAVHPASGR